MTTAEIFYPRENLHEFETIHEDTGKKGVKISWHGSQCDIPLLVHQPFFLLFAWETVEEGQHLSSVPREFYQYPIITHFSPNINIQTYYYSNRNTTNIEEGQHLGSVPRERYQYPIITHYSPNINIQTYYYSNRNTTYIEEESHLSNIPTTIPGLRFRSLVFRANHSFLWAKERNSDSLFFKSVWSESLTVAILYRVKNCQKHVENYNFFERIARFLTAKERITNIILFSRAMRAIFPSHHSFVKSDESDLLTLHI